MNSEVFDEFIGNHFVPYLDRNMRTRPVILFVDDHRSHMRQYVSELCYSLGVVLVPLHPNSTHILQPADVSVFRPLKAGWKNIVRKWKFDNYPADITRKTFGPLIQEAFADSKTNHHPEWLSSVWVIRKHLIEEEKWSYLILIRLMEKSQLLPFNRETTETPARILTGTIKPGCNQSPSECR